MLFKMSLKEIRNHPRFVLLFVLNVSLGLIGLILIENFKVGFNGMLESKSKNLLGADVRVSSRLPITQYHLDTVNNHLKDNVIEEQSNLPRMFSMATSKSNSRLVSVSTYDGRYPYYGNLKLEKTGTSPPQKLADNEVWAYPELLRQLGVVVGDSLTIGNGKFIIKDIVVDDPSQTFQMGSVAPKVFISNAGIERAELLQKGSTVNHRIFYKLTYPLSKKSEEELHKKLGDHSIQVTTPKQASENVGRVMNYLTDFLGLVSIVALFLAFVGLFYLYRSYLAAKRTEVAILSSMGMSKLNLIKLYSLHVIVIGLMGILLGVAISAALLPGLDILVSWLLPFKLNLVMTLRSVLIGTLVGTIGVFLLAFPLVVSFVGEKPADLFAEVIERKSSIQVSHYYLFIPVFLFYTLMAVYVSHSVKIGLIFVIAFGGVSVILYPLAYWLLGKLERNFSPRSLPIRLSVKTLARFKFSSISIFLALTLCSMLMILVPQIESGMRDELQGPRAASRPELFLFDIQEDQVDEIQKFFSAKSIKLLGLSPMIRSRLKSVNGKAFETDTTEAMTREDERSQRFRNRGINLSYRGTLSESEKIFKGKDFSASKFEEGKQQYPEISVEKRYADRLGVDVGDLLEFDVLGVSVIGKVVNFRSVRWTSFMPNFFLNFQPGVLEDAPKTFLATVPGLINDTKTSLLLDLAEIFPNVSVVDLKRVINKLLEIIKQMSYAFKAMGGLALMVGLMVVFSLASHQARSRQQDIVLLKILGMQHKDLSRMMIWEFGVLALAASIAGALTGILISFVISNLVFESIWALDFMAILINSALVLALCLITAWLATRRVLASKAVTMLQD